MAALPQHFPREDDDRPARVTIPWFTVAATLVSALMFAGGAVVSDMYGGNPAGMVAGAMVLALAGLLLPLPGTGGIALLLVWNGLGIALAMFLIGLFSFGMLVTFPLVMIGLALSSWPRAEGEPVASLPAIVAQVGGFVLPFLLYGALDDIGRDLLRLVGLA